MKISILLAGFTAAALSFTTLNTALAETPKQVEVVNGPIPVTVQNPQTEVSVSGTVDVSGSAVSATISGMPDVNVANVPDVYISNDEASAIPVDIQNLNQDTHMGVSESGFVHLTMYERWDFRAKGVSGRAGKEFEIPAGKALIVTDFIFRSGGQNPGEYSYVRLDTGYAGMGTSSLTLFGIATAAGVAWEKNSYVTGLRYPAGTTFGIGAWSGDFPGSVDLFGYLVDAD